LILQIIFTFVSLGIAEPTLKFVGWGH